MDSSLRLYWKKNWQRKNKKRKGGKKIETTNDSHVYCGKWWIFCSLAHCYLTIKVPRCFRSLKDASRPISVHYLSNSKAWMNSDIMETALGRLDRRMNFENHKVILVLDNAKTVLKQWKIIQICFFRAFPSLPRLACSMGVVCSTQLMRTYYDFLWGPYPFVSWDIGGSVWE